jgi:hypothetical protein
MTKRKSTKRTDVALLPARKPTVLLADVRELIYPLKCVIGQVRNSAMILVDASA